MMTEQYSINRSKNLSFIALSIFIFSFSFFIFSMFRTYDPDLWGHIKFGEYIVTNHVLPLKDLYAFTPTKDLWVNHEIIAEILFYLLYKLNYTGVALLLFKSLVFAITILIPWFYIGKKSDRYYINAIIFILVILAFSYGTAIRPHIFSYLFFAITLFIIETDKLKGKLSYIGLPIIFILWVNSHGGVIAGIAVVCFYCLYNVIISKIKFKSESEMEKVPINIKGLIIIPILLIAVLILNPYTYHYYGYITDAIMMKRNFVEEWNSIFTSMGHFQYLNLLITLTLMFIIINLNHLNREKTYQILLLVLMILVSVSHARHIPFFALTCAFYLPDLISPRISLKPVSKVDFITVKCVLPVLLLFLSAFLLYCSLINKEGKVDYKLTVFSQSSPQYVGYPVKAIEYIKKNDLKGNMMTNFNWGEYIIFNLYPDTKVSFDGRYETVYPKKVVDDNTRFTNGDKGWKDVLNNYNPDMVLLSKYDRVLKAMYESSGWPLVFMGDESFLFVNPEKK